MLSGPGQLLIPNRGHPLCNGLTAWWIALPHLVGGGKVFDVIGSNHGIIVNGPNWVGAPGQPSMFPSLKLASASSQYVDFGTVPGTQPTSTGTIAIWVNQAVTTGNQVLIGWSNFNTDRNGVSIWASGGFTRIELTSASASTITAGSVVAFSTGAWHHIVYSWDASGIYAYVDGRLLQTTAFGVTPTNGVNPIRIGSQGNSVASLWNGLIGDAAIYKPLLSAVQVSQLYQESTRGYPGMLLRIGRGVMVQPRAATGGLLLRRRRMAVMA